jgi:hypothetical protein
MQSNKLRSGGIFDREGIMGGITMSFRNFLGAVAVVLAVVAVASVLPDVKRYIRISTM